MCSRVKSGNQRIDPCLREDIKILKGHGVETVACCCGHGKYQRTILVRDIEGTVHDLVSNVVVPMKRRFYKRDGQGVFFILEVDNPLEGKET